MNKTYPIVTLCGSSKQKEDWAYWQAKFALDGNVVLAINIYMADSVPNYNDDTELKRLLCELHHQKIRMADKVVFICKPDTTLGDHTSEELEYARSLGKPCTFVYSVARYPHKLDKLEVLSISKGEKK